MKKLKPKKELDTPPIEEGPSEVKAGYQPSKAELEADVSIKATPKELAQAVFGRHPRRPQ